MVRRTATVVLLAVFLSACSSGPATCEEVADEFVVVAQDLIDDVEAQLGDQSIDSILDGGELPSLDAFTEQADQLRDQGRELECSGELMDALVSERASLLVAETPIGDLIVEFFSSGEL